MRINQTILIICFLWISTAYAQQSLIDSLETVIAKNTRDIEMSNALNKMAITFSKNNTEKSLKYAWRAKAIAKALDTDKSLSTCYGVLANIHKNASQRDSTEFYLEGLKTLAANANEIDWNHINQIYNSTTGLYYKNIGRPKEALPYLLRGYEYSKKIGKKDEIYGQAINLGNCYYQISDYKKSLQYHLIALKGFESSGNKSGQSFCYNNISNCYYEMNRFAESISYLKKSVKLKKELNDKRGLANAEQNLGNNYMGLENLILAEKHFKNAIALNKELDNVSGLIANYFNIGKMYSEKEPQTAISFFNSAKTLAIENGDTNMVSKIDLEILANNTIKEKQLQNEKNAILNIQAFKEAGKKRDEADGYKNLADYYTQLGQFDKALEYTNMYHDLRDSLKSNEILAQFKNIEEQYNKEKNEKQIILLQKDKEINEQKLNRQRFLMIIFGLVIISTGVGIYMFVNRYRLKQRMQELELRNRIAADLHDEVGSSLSSIYMLSEMAGKNQFDAKGEIMERIKTNAQETMERMGDIVWMIKPNANEGEGLKYRMERFVTDICNSQNIQCNFSAEDLNEVKLSMKQKKNMYLIFKEAVNNAIKYSQTKKLEIQIAQHGKQLEMTIKDYGNGFDEKIVLKGNGLENMQSRATELKGNLRLTSLTKHGTEIHLSFPLS